MLVLDFLPYVMMVDLNLISEASTIVVTNTDEEKLNTYFLNSLLNCKRDNYCMYIPSSFDIAGCMQQLLSIVNSAVTLLPFYIKKKLFLI